MGRWTILVLRIVIALSLVGSVIVQTVIVPLLWADLAAEPMAPRVTLTVLAVLGVLTMQVFAVCVWRLLTMVRRGSVFSRAAFRHVDVIIGAVVGAALVVFAFAVLLAGGQAAPGVVGIVCGISLVLGGMALLVVVMRMLLTQAISLRTELDEVI
jgi:hypothetical protein